MTSLKEREQMKQANAMLKEVAVAFGGGSAADKAKDKAQKAKAMLAKLDGSIKKADELREQEAAQKQAERREYRGCGCGG